MQKINEAQKDDRNIYRSGKKEFPQSIPLRYLLSAYHRLPLSHMANIIVIVKKKKTIYQFQVEN